MPRSREYKYREHFMSTAEHDKLEAVREICRREKIPMNSIIHEAFDKFIEQYDKGEYAKKAELEVPSVLTTKNEILKWAWQVGPVVARQALSNLPFLEKALREQMDPLERNWQNWKAKQKEDPLQKN